MVVYPSGGDRRSGRGGPVQSGCPAPDPAGEIRGGTDGAMLSYKGLLTPNIFAGGMNFHSKREYVPVESMEAAVKSIIGILGIYVERS